MPLEETVQHFASKRMDASNKAEKAENRFMKAIDNQQKELLKSNNMIHDIKESIGDHKDQEKIKRLERTAAFIGINDVVGAVGDSIAALGGVNPLGNNDGSLDYALKHLDSGRNKIQDDYNERNKNMLKESIRRDQKNEKAQTRVFNGLEGVMNHKNKMADNAIKQESDFITASVKEQNERAQESRKVQNEIAKEQRKNISTRAKTKKADGAVMYVLDKNGKKVGLDQPHVTQLYQLGQLYNIDLPFKDAKSERIREIEYPVLIQRSYNIFERDKSELNKINSDIKNSAPFTLKTK